MDWKQIILMAKGKAYNPENQSDPEQLIWRARLLLENTIQPAVREVLEFLEDNEIPVDKTRPHYIDDPDQGIGVQLIIGDDKCSIDIFLGLTKEAIIGRLYEYRFVHLNRTLMMELPMNETRINASEVKRILAEDVRVYFQCLEEAKV